MERWYGTQVNGTEEFRNLIAAQLRPEHYVLDLGCGSGRKETDFRDKCAYVVGCDFTNHVLQNKFVSAGVRGDAYKLPFSDCTFDVVTMDFVMEHLELPDRCSAEIFRVLKPGGSLFFRTPNFYHYVAIIAYLTPHWVHRLVVRKLAESDETDPFETYYRVNTRKAVGRVLAGASLTPMEIKMIEKEPYYLTFASPAFFLGHWYERLVNEYSQLASFRACILGHFTKPVGDDASHHH
jgi:ubiquinone/menaquinone biosynthesis C-methylase UbiE